MDGAIHFWFPVRGAMSSWHDAMVTGDDVGYLEEVLVHFGNAQ